MRQYMLILFLLLSCSQAHGEAFPDSLEPNRFFHLRTEVYAGDTIGGPNDLPSTPEGDLILAGFINFNGTLAYNGVIKVKSNEYIYNTTPGYSARGYCHLFKHNASYTLLAGSNGAGTALADCVWMAADPMGTWVQSTSGTKFTARVWSGAVQHNGYLYIMGGGASFSGGWYSDTWRSADGHDWAQIATQTPYATTQGIRFPKLLSFKNKIWCLSGYNPTTSAVYSGVQYSDDGITWSTATSTPPFASAYLGCVWADEKFMYYDGGVGSSILYRSSDGVNWTILNRKPYGVEEARYNHSSGILHGLRFILGNGNASAVFRRYPLRAWR